jgi:hypothetical protein
MRSRFHYSIFCGLPAFDGPGYDQGSIPLETVADLKIPPLRALKLLNNLRMKMRLKVLAKDI